MPTLANFDGRSLVADISRALGNVEQFGERERQKTALQEAEDLAVTAAGGTPQPRQKGPLNFLSKIAPDLFADVQNLIAGRADPSDETVKAIDTTRARAKSNISVANKILAEPDPVKKQRIVREDAERIRAAGGDVTQHVRMSNLSPDKLDLQAQKIKMSAEATTRAVPAPTAAEREIARIKLSVRAPAAAEALRRQELQNVQIAEAERQRLAEEAAPKTELGQKIAAIGQDVQNGVIPQNVGQALAQRAVTQATATPAPKFQTDVGKLIGDQETVNQIYGANSPQAKAIGEMLTGELKGEAPKLSDVGGIRKEFTKLSSNFIARRDALANIQQAVKNPSAPNDVAIVFAFMKMLDPTSVVRESEQQTLQRAQSLTGRVGNVIAQMARGESISPELRQGVLDAAKGMFTQAESQHTQRETEFRALAERSGINPEDVVIDFRAPSTDEAAPDTLPEVNDKAAFDALQSGQEFMSGGKRFKKP